MEEERRCRRCLTGAGGRGRRIIVKTHPGFPVIKVTVPACLLWQTFKNPPLLLSGNLDLLCLAISCKVQGQLSLAGPAGGRRVISASSERVRPVHALLGAAAPRMTVQYYTMES